MQVDRGVRIADDQLDLVANPGAAFGCSSSILVCSAESFIALMGGRPRGAGIAASPLIAFLPASTTMRVGVGRLVTVVSMVSAGAKSTW